MAVCFHVANPNDAIATFFFEVDFESFFGPELALFDFAEFDGVLWWSVPLKREDDGNDLQLLPLPSPLRPVFREEDLELHVV